jgi:hypothetical protein
MPLIEYERLRRDLLERDSGSKPFVSNDRAILFSPSKKSLNVDQRAIASHTILPTREELKKSNVLAYVVGFAWHPSRDVDDKNLNVVGDTLTSPKAGFYMINSQQVEIPDIFRYPVRNKYERFRYFLRGEIELIEKKELYANILDKVKEPENGDKMRKIFLFEGDSLGVKARHEAKELVERILFDRMKVRKTHPIWLIGIHTSLDYTFSEILHEFLGEMMNNYVSQEMPMVLKRCDSILLSCMKAGERTALFENPENDYTLSFYCKPNFPDYDIYPFKMDIFVGKKVRSRSRGYDLINKVDEVADEIMTLFSNPDLSWITSDDTAGRIIGANRLLPISLKEVYDKLRSEMYYDEKKTEPNTLTTIYKKYTERT